MIRSHADIPSTLRGRSYGAEIEDRGENYYLGISNNNRNSRLATSLAVWLTTTRKPPMPSIVYLSDVDAPWAGAISCDDIEKIYADDVTRDYGALPVSTLRHVDDALGTALTL